MNNAQFTEEHPDEGLLKIYLDRVLALATRATDGANVTDELRKTVQAAATQFSQVLGGSELAYLRVFAGRLHTNAMTAAKSPPSWKAWRAALDFARELTNERIKELEGRGA